jgi:hypothetical protein
MKRSLALGLLAFVAFTGTAAARGIPLARWGDSHAYAPVHVSKLPLAPTTLLVTLEGQPVGGRWQQWVDESEAPTVLGPLTFSTDVSSAGCIPPPPATGATIGTGTATGCSHPKTAAMPAITAVTPGTGARGALYFELGHQFDWRYLTSHDRQFLARLWGAPHSRWFDSAHALALGGEDGLEADFALVYEDCALGQPSGTSIIPLSPPGVPSAPQIWLPAHPCRYLARIALAHGD